MPSVVEQTPYNEYTANGVTDTFAYEFQLLSADDLEVYDNGTLVPSSDYTVTGVGDQDGGDVEFATLPASGRTILLQRSISLERDIEYQYNGPFPAATVNLDFNRVWQALQGFWSRLTGAVRAPFPEQLDELPAAEDRALQLLGFDADGQPIAVAPTSGSASDLALLLTDTSSASSGDYRLGVLRVGVGSTVARTQHGKNEDTAVTPFDFIPEGTDLSSTDVTTYLQTGLTACSAAAAILGRPIYIHCTGGHRFRVSAKLNVPTLTGFTGDGSCAIYPLNTGFTNVNPDTYGTSTSTVLDLSGETSSDYTPNYSQKVQGIRFDGSNIAEGKSCNVIRAINCVDLQITDNEIHDFKHSKTIIVASLRGASLIARNNIHDITSNTVFASHPTFADRAYVNITGIDVDDDCITDGTIITSDDLVIEGNYIENLNHGATAIATYGNQADGIYVNKGSGATIRGNRIKTTSEGIDSLGHDGLIEGNVIRDCTEFGLKLIHGARRNIVRGNRVFDSGLASCYVGVSDVTANGDTYGNIIEGNIFEGVDPDNLNAGATTGCIKLANTGSGSLVSRDNTFRDNSLNPGTYGEWAIINNSTGDVRNVFDGNRIQAAGADGTYLMLSTTEFEITPRISTRVNVYPSAATAIATATWTKFTFNTVGIDSLDEFDTANNRWVCSVPGYYRITVNGTLAACRGMYLAVRKNGSASEIAITPLLDFASDSAASGQLCFTTYMSVADYLEAWVYHGSGANRAIVTGNANSWMLIEKA